MILRSDFHFELPRELIAQRPAPTRSAARLLELEGHGGTYRDLQFADLPGLLRAEDLLVLNDTRVIPARAFGIKHSGGRIELLLERVLGPTTALVHARASKGLRPGAMISLAGDTEACMVERRGELYCLEFSRDVLSFFEEHGEVPLPPYLGRAADTQDQERYQTIFAQRPGAVAAPTAGLHFDAASFAALDARGVQRAFITLHVGAGTFAPVRSLIVAAHRMHAEYLEVPLAVCEAIQRARAAGGRVIAVGTTVVRSLGDGGRRRCGRGLTAASVSRHDRDLHHPGISFSCRGCAGHEFSPARIDAA